MKPTCLVLAKKRLGLDEVVAYLNDVCGDVCVCVGERGQPPPPESLEWLGDLLISYASPWIVPAALLGRARMATINFHPGPPEYPGTGCTNFAIYDGVREYGVTAHHMAPTVDTGPIIAVRRFAVDPTDDVWTVTQRAYEHLYALLRGVIGALVTTGRLPDSMERWKRAPFRRSELEALCRVTADMSREEVARRIKATTFPGMPGAYIELFGHRFAYLPEENLAQRRR